METVKESINRIEIWGFYDFKKILFQALSAIKDNFKYTHNSYLTAKMINYYLQWFAVRYIMNKNIGENVNKLKNWIIFDTPFGKYLCTTVAECKMMRDNYEKDIYDIINQISSKDDWDSERYCINVWANIWRRSINLAKNFWYKVLAFEPAPSTFEHLQTNIWLSWLKNEIEAYNIGLWNSDEELPFTVWDIADTTAHINDENFIHKCKCITQTKEISVPINKFDNLWIDAKKIESTKLILIDVEWFEFNVLKWMANALKLMWDVDLIVEIWSDQKERDETIRFIKSLWFSAKQINRDYRLFSKWHKEI